MVDQRENIPALGQAAGEGAGLDGFGEATDPGGLPEHRGVALKAAARRPVFGGDAALRAFREAGRVMRGTSRMTAKLSGWRTCTSAVSAVRTCTLPRL
jgi:hypothetical protein